MQLYGFHTMPYPDVTHEDVDRSPGASSVTLPNSLYDPVRGSELYDRYLEDFVTYDRAGFDGVCVNEHHQTCFGLMPSPNISAAALIPLVQCKIAILGNAIPLRENPVRIAEEIAMLDVMSKGRIVSGFVRGLGNEYQSLTVDPTQSFARFDEAHDLIIKAWTEPGPFEWYGKHYKFRYVNPWPRTYQQPHPPIWTPGGGSPDLIDWAARHRYGYSMSFGSRDYIARIFDEFREVAETRYGYTAPPELTQWSVVIHVADTDEEAWRQAKPYVEWEFNVASKTSAAAFSPPGHQSISSKIRKFKQAQATSSKERGDIESVRHTFEDINEAGIVIAGSPETVRQRLEESFKVMRFGTLLGTFEIGGLPQDEFAKSVSLFSEKVWPHLRDLDKELSQAAASATDGA